MPAFHNLSALRQIISQSQPLLPQQNAFPPSSFILYAPPSEIFHAVEFFFPSVSPPIIPLHENYYYEIAVFHHVFDCLIPCLDAFVTFMLIRR